jgi:hypothetical protein
MQKLLNLARDINLCFGEVSALVKLSGRLVCSLSSYYADKGNKILYNVNKLLQTFGAAAQKTAILITGIIFPAVGLQDGWCIHNHRLGIGCILYYVWNSEMCWEAEGQC